MDEIKHHHHHHHSTKEEDHDYAQEFRNRSFKSIKRRKWMAKRGFRLLVAVALLMLIAVYLAYNS